MWRTGFTLRAIVLNYTMFLLVWFQHLPVYSLCNQIMGTTKCQVSTLKHSCPDNSRLILVPFCKLQKDFFLDKAGSGVLSVDQRFALSACIPPSICLNDPASRLAKPSELDTHQYMAEIYLPIDKKSDWNDYILNVHIEGKRTMICWFSHLCISILRFWTVKDPEFSKKTWKFHLKKRLTTAILFTLKSWLRLKGECDPHMGGLRSTYTG